MQHFWKNNLDDRLKAVFEDAKAHLKWAWKVDCKHPKSYPVNTLHALGEIMQKVTNPTYEPKRVTLQELKLQRPPKRLLELVDEMDIKGIYEDQNTGSYEEAIRAAYGFGGSRTWRKILRAIDAAYFFRLGDELAPRPRVHFLHRKLLEIANAEPLKGLTVDGLSEFLDDLCPCGKKHKPDAIRKLRGRVVGHRTH